MGSDSALLDQSLMSNWIDKQQVVAKQHSNWKWLLPE
jgi:hypothetical protein